MLFLAPPEKNGSPSELVELAELTSKEVGYPLVLPKSALLLSPPSRLYRPSMSLAPARFSQTGPRDQLQEGPSAGKQPGGGRQHFWCILHSSRIRSTSKGCQV